jgi:hypothetical protein
LPRVIGAGELKRVIAFVVDTLHIKFENVARTRKMLSDFVDNKSRRDTFQRPPGALSMPSTGGASADPFEEADVRATLSALKETIKSMSKLPGRKVSVFVSEGFRLFATQTTQDLNETTALAARATVVFYTIDPRGLDPVALTAADEIDRDLDVSTAVTEASNRKRADFFESQDSLNAIALDTGGKFFRNNNDIKRGLDDIIEENSAYYMLGFYPESARWDGKYHNAQAGFVATRTINVKPGVYQIRLFVREVGVGTIGTANDYIEIPDMKADRLSTSSLFLSGQALEQGKLVQTAGIGGTPSQRRFQRNGEFSYSMVIYNAKPDDSKQPQLEMRTRVFKGNQVVFSGQLRPVVPSEGSVAPSKIITGGVITLLKLAPDDYTLEVTVRDKRRKKDNVVRTEMDFSVE